jgi:hypothetical protein
MRYLTTILLSLSINAAKDVLQKMGLSSSEQDLERVAAAWCEEQGRRYVDQEKLRDALNQAFPKIDEWRSEAGLGKWNWLGDRDSNPDQMVQSHPSYH